MNNLKKSKLIRFKKEEIHQIMELYSKKITIGEWKDYSISFQKTCATFAIHIIKIRTGSPKKAVKEKK